MSSINAQPGSTTQPTALITSGDNTSTLTFQSNGIIKFLIDANQNALCNITGATAFPTGTTAQRPASPVNGMVRFNTTNNALEGYANSSWIGFI